MKFVISDSNGRKYLAKSTLKLDSKSDKRVKDECIENNMHDADNQLTDDEIKTLKELVKYADSLFNLVKSDNESDLDESNDEDNTDINEKSEEVIEYSTQSEDEEQNLNDDIDTDIDEDNIGNVVNTDLSDSANSYGSIENQNRVSSSDDMQEAIINAWKNRKY